EKESPEKSQEYLSNNQHRRLRKKVAETNEECEQKSKRPVIAVSIDALYLASENIATTSQSESFENAGASTNLQQESERPVIGVNIETIDSASENNNISSQSENNKEIDIELQSATTISEYEKKLLRKFCTKMKKQLKEIQEVDSSSKLNEETEEKKRQKR
ncbi:22074_t:CDS:2, partial [Gigaspora rosea]